MRGFSDSSCSFFIMNLGQFFQQSVFILLVGYYLSAAELGCFRAAERTAMLILFITAAINTVYPPRFARLHRSGNRKEILRLTRQAAMVGAALASPLMIVCVMIPERVLAIYGPTFADGALILQIVVICQFFNVCTGPVGHVLAMCGRENAIRNISIGTVFASLMMLLCLTPAFGPIGAALSIGSIPLIQNTASLFFVRKFFKSA